MIIGVDYHTRGMGVSFLVWMILNTEQWGEAVVIKWNWDFKKKKKSRYVISITVRSIRQTN